MEAAAQLGGRGLGPEGEAIGSCSTLRVGEQVESSSRGLWIQSGESRGPPPFSTRAAARAKIRSPDWPGRRRLGYLFRAGCRWLGGRGPSVGIFRRRDRFP